MSHSLTPTDARATTRRRRAVGGRLLAVALVVTLVSGTTIAMTTDDSPASASATDPRGSERTLADDRAARFVERANLTVERATGKVDEPLRSALRRAIDEVSVQAASAARTPRPFLTRGLLRLRNAIEHGATLDAEVRHATTKHDLSQADAARLAAEKAAAEAAEAERVAAEQAAAEAERVAAEQAAAEAAEAQRVAAEKAAADKAAAEKAAADKAASVPAPPAPETPAPAPGPSIREIGEATLRGLPGNGGVSISWDDPGLSGHLGGVWKGNTSTILVNATRLAGQPSKTKDASWPRTA
jgi:chemotaxis protein histidine kinase CheA